MWLREFFPRLGEDWETVLEPWLGLTSSALALLPTPEPKARLQQHTERAQGLESPPCRSALLLQPLRTAVGCATSWEAPLESPSPPPLSARKAQARQAALRPNPARSQALLPARPACGGRKMLGQRSLSSTSLSWPGACSVSTRGLSSRAKRAMQLEGKISFRPQEREEINLGEVGDATSTHINK